MTQRLLSLLFALQLLVVLTGLGQSVPAPAVLPQRVPPAPNTAALERYALMPVNEPAGIPTISIPLHEIHSGQLTLPITASYHASGVRVTDMASWLGLVWALNAGGVITRVVRGGPDENPDSFKANCALVPDYGSIRYPLQVDSLDRIAKNRIDFQPDLYTFNMSGQAGTFMMDNKGAYQMLPLQPVRVTALDTAFLLTDAQGIQYFFGSKERITYLPRPTPDKNEVVQLEERVQGGNFLPWTS